jgi:adenylate cyclase
VTDEVDFAAEGLLDGLEGAARDGRLALLRELHDDGVPLAELRDAVAEQRLALLPVERLLGGELRLSGTELADRAGIDPELFAQALAALGMPATGDRRFGDADLEGARRLRTALDSGLPADRIVDVNRVIGRAMAQVAAAIHSLVGETYLHAGDTEDVVAARYAAAAQALLPTLGPTLEHAFALHLRELLRGDTIDAATLRTGSLAGTEQLAVAFADLVGFTSLGESAPLEELSGVAGRLGELTTGLVEPPVRFVKQIGDAVMLVSPDAARLVDTVVRLVDATCSDESFPPLRAGIAFGPAVNRWGDWYGAPVNLASRLTARARPASVLATGEVRERAPGAQWSWSSAGPKKLKGITAPVKTYRVRREEPDG